MSERNLYEVTGDIKDINTLLVPRAQLEAMAGEQKPVYQGALAENVWIDLDKEAHDDWVANKGKVRTTYAAPVAQQPQGEVVVTWNEQHIRILAVPRQDKEGRILSVIAEAPTQPAQAEAVPIPHPLYDSGLPDPPQPDREEDAAERRDRMADREYWRRGVRDAED